MWLMLQHKALRFSYCNWRNSLVRELIEKAFEIAGYNIYWEVVDYLVGKCSDSNDVLVYIDPYYFRPTEVENLHGNPTKAAKVLGWKATTKFDELVKIMMEFELKKN